MSVEGGGRSVEGPITGVRFQCSVSVLKPETSQGIMIQRYLVSEIDESNERREVNK